MLYYLTQRLLDLSAGTAWAEELSALRLFRYITFRSAGAAVTALLLSWWFGPRVIAWLKQLKFGQDYADKAEEGGGLAARILSKKGTPTMGGIMIVSVLDVTALLWTQWNALVLLTLLSVAVLCGLGFYDDYAKIIQQSGGGTKPQVKLWVQVALAIFIGVYLWMRPSTSKLVTEIMVPFYKYPLLSSAGLVGLLVTVATIVGSSNAVNLTDGLDGLAIGCTVIAAGAFTMLTYVSGHALFADYLEISKIPQVSELTIFCGSMVGSAIGFLWYNAHPAEVFMGDVGSLALGGAIGTVAVLIKQELLLPFIGGVFVIEALSVILQVGSYKLRKKRIFKMAPIHHHFEKKGWYESQVVMRFYILCVLFAVVALSSLKIR